MPVSDIIEAVMFGPPKLPHELFVDLHQSEDVPRASLCVMKIEPNRVAMGVERDEGLLISADRGAHDADFHLSWQQVRELRDTLSRLLNEANQE